MHLVSEDTAYKLNILILVKRFDLTMPKHAQKFSFINTLQKWANVTFWHDDDHIEDILETIQVTPDFIFHYDMAWQHAFSPKIRGLKNIDIPKGCFVIDLHYDKSVREQYFEKNRIDIIFSTYKQAFFEQFPELISKFCWLPWSIDPAVYKNWELQKEYDYLLMGLLNTGQDSFPPLGKYKFREDVYQEFKNKSNFKFHKHPGHRTDGANRAHFLNKECAHEVNKAKIFFTCGSILQYPVQKFFEVPACNTLLLAEPNKDILELGFKDKINFIACNSDNFKVKADYYLEHESLREYIARAGHNFIHNHHTHDHRAQQFIQAIKEKALTSTPS